MSYILGIDTGGTFTDGVLMEYSTKKVKNSAKAFTTKENLTVGITECIDSLGIEETDDICLVCLSTTLATNAIVEKKELPVGLITIGDSNRNSSYPAKITVNIQGKQDVMGRELQPVYEDEVRSTLESMKGKVDALAISGYASVRNPQQEVKVCTIAQEVLSIPVVCAYELTSALGFYERTVTAVLNAKLIPIITDLVDKTKQVLAERGIDAPVIIVKGDGHLMIDSFAMEHPVETILSGPAASVVGGKFLTGLIDGIIVDMGGTTTDIVVVDKGQVNLIEEGATVGGWKTRVKAVQVSSYGLGGDSYINISHQGEIQIQPYKVMPLCIGGEKYPYLYDELEKFEHNGEYRIVKRMEADCLRLMNMHFAEILDLTERELAVIDMLKEGAHSLLYIADKLETDIDSLGIDRLIKCDIVQLISMTPTDILHITGEFVKWDRNMSMMGAKLYANAMGITAEEFSNEAENAVVYKMASLILQSVLESDGLNFSSCGEGTGDFIINTLLGRTGDCNLKCKGTFCKPIIGIGAPANVWVKKAAQLLDARFILPEHDGVANAVGAAVSNVREFVEALISYDAHIGKLVAFLPDCRLYYDSLEEAKEKCTEYIMDYARTLSEKLDIASPDIIIRTEDEYIENKTGCGSSLIYTKISAEIIGDISLKAK
ncbi:MAG: hydantoinase/oxoprolinase N-terminal domain-containing protein [Anaerovoracaceae bacterium]